MKPTIVFDPELHRYLVDGKTVPSVTTVLQAAMNFGGVPVDVLELAQKRGTAVHKAIDLELQGVLDPATVDERVLPYLEAFRKFRSESGFIMERSECKVASGRYGFAGTLDLAGTLPATRSRLSLIDHKTALSLPVTTGPQTAGYEVAYRETFDYSGGIDRFALQLKKDATYKLTPLPRASDGAVFLSALTLWRWVRDNRIEIATAGRD